MTVFCFSILNMLLHCLLLALLLVRNLLSYLSLVLFFFFLSALKIFSLSGSWGAGGSWALVLMATHGHESWSISRSMAFKFSESWCVQCMWGSSGISLLGHKEETLASPGLERSPREPGGEAAGLQCGGRAVPSLPVSSHCLQGCHFV